MPDSAARYGKVGKNLMNGNIDVMANGLKIILLKTSYTPNLDTHETITDLVLASNQCSGSPYTAGGLLVDAADVTETYSSANKNTLYSCPDQTLDNATISDIKYIAYADRSTGYLLSLQTLASAQSPSAQQFKVRIAGGTAAGFLTV
jgi:hypothetical protein